MSNSNKITRIKYRWFEWTKDALDCYYLRGNCSVCPINRSETLKDCCRMKNYVETLIEKIGAPPPGGNKKQRVINEHYKIKLSGQQQSALECIKQNGGSITPSKLAKLMNISDSHANMVLLAIYNKDLLKKEKRKYKNDIRIKSVYRLIRGR